MTEIPDDYLVNPHLLNDIPIHINKKPTRIQALDWALSVKFGPTNWPIDRHLLITLAGMIDPNGNVVIGTNNLSYITGYTTRNLYRSFIRLSDNKYIQRYKRQLIKPVYKDGHGQDMPTLYKLMVPHDYHGGILE